MAVDQNSLRSTFRVVLTCSVSGALAGALLGLAIGLGSPNYYRSVFEDGRSAGFDPLQMGIGLGGTQGGVAGFCLGLVLLWRSRSEFERTKQSTALTVPKVFVWGAGATVLLGIGAFSLGRLFDESRGQGMRLSWQGKLLNVHNYGLQDRVATHLSVGNTQAALQPPIYVKSHVTNLDIDPARLKWIEADGKPTVAPAPGERVEVITHEAFATSTPRTRD